METGQPVDQSKYEPLFASATAVLEGYRDLLGVRALVPEELARILHGRAKPAGKAGVAQH
jgi:hypothetical protein